MSARVCLETCTQKAASVHTFSKTCCSICTRACISRLSSGSFLFRRQSLGYEYFPSYFYCRVCCKRIRRVCGHSLLIIISLGMMSPILFDRNSAMPVQFLFLVVCAKYCFPRARTFDRITGIPLSYIGSCK